LKPPSAATGNVEQYLSSPQATVAAALVGAKGEDIKSSRQISKGVVAITVASDAINSIRSNSNIADVFIDQLASPSLQHSVPIIGADFVQAENVTGDGYAVAILDSGVDSTHPALAGQVISEACFSTNDPTQSSSSICPSHGESETGPLTGAPCDTSLSGCEHGTHVAGIVASKTGNLDGNPIIGVAPGARIVSIQVFSKITSTAVCGAAVPACIRSWTSDQIAALEYIRSLSANMKIAAVNMSLDDAGTRAAACDNDARKTEIDQLRSLGMLTVVAAGNNGTANGLAAPACISTAISVGASQGASAVATAFSDRSAQLTILAPGAEIHSTWPVALGGGYHALDGTSMAAPHVAGVIALLRSKYPSATPMQLIAAILNGTPLIRDPDANRSYHLLNARIAVSNLQSSTIAAVGSSPQLRSTASSRVTMRAIVTTPTGIDKPSDVLSSDLRGKVVAEKRLNDRQFIVTAPKTVIDRLRSRMEVQLDQLAAPSDTPQK
jgi:subtilisin family serine protease